MVDQLATNPRTTSLPTAVTVTGARENNLRNEQVELPHYSLVVFTGVSGSGKSSLAFETIYAEAQRRQLQSMSSFARQLMGELEKPDVDQIDGLSPAVALDQSTTSRNPRSTVGTTTEVYDLLRVVFAGAGVPHCLVCDVPLDAGATACQSGHRGAVPEMHARAFSFNQPIGACPDCEGLGEKLDAAAELVIPDQRLSVATGAISPWRGAITEAERLLTVAVLEAHGESAETPWRDLPAEVRDLLLHVEALEVTVRQRGRDKARLAEYTGVLPWVRRRYRDAPSSQVRNFMLASACPTCRGGRLRPEQLAVRVGGRSIAELTELPVDDLLSLFDEWEKAGLAGVADQAVGEICARLRHLVQVGLGYLSLDRSAPTLSGGESQRIRLATQLGTQLFGLLYVLDEPTMGLHPSDVESLVASLQALRDQGNTVLVVEHNRTVIEKADWVVELGPGAGSDGGRIIFSGTVDDLVKSESSPTGDFLAGRRRVGDGPPADRVGSGVPGHLVLRGARAHNLKEVDVRLPLDRFVVVTGVSGSGKSTLIDHTLYRAVAQALGMSEEPPAEHDSLVGAEHLTRVLRVDQSPIGRTPRSNPATYVGAFDAIRKVFAQTDLAKRRGYKSSRFSFNSSGGRCESCSGDGAVRVEMHFLPDVFSTCDQCEGRRYKQETLDVEYLGRTISDVLTMSIGDAHEFFAGNRAIARSLGALVDVGLGYLQLGQPANTLSGGEAQRVKLANELQRTPSGRTLYILDEPTAGLHPADTAVLSRVLHELVDHGHTVVVVTHDLDVVGTADWVVDLGPGGGDSGGRVVVAGAVDEVARADTPTGFHLRKMLFTD
ncbi:excinuclease ABC subunit UvrA [Saccharopolyspora cebuensis]|uniref:excinuclease ABC subunit UvrA n=1 Tax=Saccharopolyspora cebuensis TaxID=418759 RepID=UPI0031EAE6AE